MHLEGVLIEDQKGDTLIAAGEIKVRITDWFVFKNEAELKYIGINNAVIKMQRTDSVWRQQFILDYFSSPSTGKKKKAGIQFNLKKIELNNVAFVKKDAWLGNDLLANIGSLSLDAKNFNLSGNAFEINSLLLKNPEVSLKNYVGLKPPNDNNSNAFNKADSSTAKNTTPIFKIANLKIINGSFRNDKETERKAFSYFDGQHIAISEINGELSNSTIIGDTIISKINLTAKERSGLELKKLDATFKLTPQGMAFTNMTLMTNRSTLRNSFKMSYDDISDMSDFIRAVKMEANFDDTYIDSDDIAFFAPELSTWKKTITAKGIVRGTVDNLVARNMSLHAGKNTVLEGDFSLRGLPDINQTFIDFSADNFKTTYSDATTMVPALRSIKTPRLSQIQYLNFTGSFTGFIRDFVTFGTIQTNLGTVTSDLNMKLPKGQEPAYSGSIATNNFQLGKFLGEPNLGTISMKGSLKGRGFNENTRNALIDGDIKQLTYSGYQYSNISIKGNLNKKLFEGYASMKDPNANFDLNGIIDLNQKTPRFDLIANVNNANLYKLNLTKDSIEFKGRLNFNFTSSSIDDFLGNARISQAEITRNGRHIPFDSLTVRSSFIDGKKVFTALSNEFALNVTGDFNLTDLPNGVTYLLNRYYPAYIKAPKSYPKNQNFAFVLSTQYVDEYIQMIDSSLTGLNFSHITGSVNLKENLMNLTADVPQFKFKQYNFDNVTINATGDASRLKLTGEAYNIRLNDSLNIPKTAFSILASNDSSRVSILSGANRNVDTANLNALVLTYHDGVKIEFDPSTFNINNKMWSIDESGELEFRSSIPANGQLILKSGDQNITMKTRPSRTGGTWNDMNVQLTNVNVGDFSPLFLPKNRLEGLLSGNLLVEDPFNNLKVSSSNIETKFLRLDNDSLGELKANLSYDNVSKLLTINGNTLNQENYLGFDGKLYLGSDPALAKNNLIALKAKQFYLKILERFLGTLFTDIQGYLTGDIKVSGAFNDLQVTGKGTLKDAGLKVIFTQCFYKIKDTPIELTPTLINLDGIVLTDTLSKNPIYITGGIEHQAFKNMFYNLDISTRKPKSTDEKNNRPVLLINTTYRDNKQFYGFVKGTGSLSLLGPQDNMYMKIDAIASDKDSSYITLPPSSTKENGLSDFLVERKFGREMNVSDIKTSDASIIYDVDVTANPMVTVKVVLDELTGDEIKGKGSGTLNIRSGTTEPLSLRGKFDILEGSYLFTFQSFFKKPFELRKNAGNYIEWNGDPYNANINFEAAYKAERVSYAPLVTSLNLNSNIVNQRGDVYVVAKLTDKLFKPEIEFSLDFPSSSVAVTEPELALVIQQMQKNVNELNRQVTYLIVFNSFAPSELGQGDVSSGLGINTISGIFLNVISDQINKILGGLIKSDKYKINLNTTLYNRNIIDQSNSTALNLGSNVNFTIGRSFFNNRFSISTGVGFDAPLQQSSIQQNIQLLPDVTLEWLINPSGSIRASFFYRENADFLNASSTSSAGRARRVGGSISYKKDFDKLSEIFRKKSTPLLPIVPPPDSTQALKPDSAGQIIERKEK